MASAYLKDKNAFGIGLIRAGQETGGAALPEQVGGMVGVIDWDAASGCAGYCRDRHTAMEMNDSLVRIEILTRFLNHWGSLE